jgi:UDP-N-acetylenolpyruvoylglucosamine reductase
MSLFDRMQGSQKSKNRFQYRTAVLQRLYKELILKCNFAVLTNSKDLIK